MELVINQNYFAKCELDISKFKSLLVKDFDLKKAIYQSTKIKEIKVIEKATLLEALWLGINWGTIIDMFNDINNKIMTIKFHDCMLFNFRRYYPGERNVDGTSWKFEEEDLNTDGTIMIQSFLRNPNSSIEDFLSNQFFNYGKRDWKIVVTEGDIKDGN